MAITRDKIHELLEFYTVNHYAQTRANQEEYISYYDDTFPVPWIDDIQTVSRTGSGAEVVDQPVEQISAAKLIASREPLKDTDKAQKSASRVSSTCNDWIRRLMRVNPNPKKQNLKNKFLFGESWIHPLHNPDWVKAPFDRSGLPVFFLIPDPRIIYASPNEDENGVPEHVLVRYDRMPWIIKLKYPAWTNPKNAGSGSGSPDTTTWVEYWDRETRYFEADGEQVLWTPNPYRFVPFVHKLSGFGKSSNEGKPEDLIVGRIHKYRDLLKRDASIVSDIDSYIHMFCMSPVVVTPPEGGTIPEKFNEQFVWKAGHVIENPNKLDIKRAVDLSPDTKMFAWHDRVQAALGRTLPDVLSGVPQGETGRLQDLTYAAAMRKWEGIVAGDEDQWATAMGMALRMCDNMPGLMPDGLSSEDLGKNYSVNIELRADDPLETARKSADGDYKQQAGIIDWKTNLVRYQGYTSEEADDVMDNAIIDRVIATSPVIQELIAMNVARELGMEQELAAIQQAMAEQGGAGNRGGIGAQGGEPRKRNIKSELGREMPDMSTEKKPVRMPPSG